MKRLLVGLFVLGAGVVCGQQSTCDPVDCATQAIRIVPMPLAPTQAALIIQHPSLTTTLRASDVAVLGLLHDVVKERIRRGEEPRVTITLRPAVGSPSGTDEGEVVFRVEGEGKAYTVKFKNAVRREAEGDTK